MAERIFRADAVSAEHARGALSEKGQSMAAEREIARFLAAIRNDMSDQAVKATAFELADVLAGSREDRLLLENILRKGAAAVKRDEDV
jgi:hypothetical protein